MTARRIMLAHLALALLAALACGGCADDPSQGYTFRRPFDESVDTVAVPIWTRGRSVYTRDLEFRLTNAIKRQIELDTPWKTVPRSRADTELTGQIRVIERRTLAGNPDTGLPRETEDVFVLHYTWKDLRTGKVKREWRNVRVAGTFLPSPPYEEEFSQGAEDVINKAARRVVQSMESRW